MILCVFNLETLESLGCSESESERRSCGIEKD